MRILLVHNRYRFAGGEERHVDLLEAGLRRQGHDVARFEASSTRASAEPIARRLAYGALMTYSPISARAFRAALARFQPDVVHAHNLLPLLTPSVLRQARATGARVVLTAQNYRLFCPAGTLMRDGRVHDDCVRGSSLLCALQGARASTLENLAYGAAVALQRRFRLVERWTDAIVVPSGHVRTTLGRAGFDTSRIHVVPNGVDIAAWEPRRREFGLYAGRLSPEKGIETLLEASKLVDFPLLVAGAGPLEPEVRRAANGTLRYLGQLGREELAEVRRRAAFVVVPSVCPEVHPFAAIEALADGTPIVVTENGGLPDLAAGGGGVICPPNDAPALARAMSKVWKAARADERFGEEALAVARERYSLDLQVARLLEIYGASG
jgi:glycosyltransferase involved in cell wall biosynthesis